VLQAPGPNRLAALALCLSALALVAPVGARAAPSRAATYRPGVVLVGFRPGVSAARQRAIRAEVGARGAKVLLRGARRTALTRLRVRPSRMRAAIRALRRDPRVRYAEPDYLLHESAAPNDPSFSLQWGSRNTGQLVNGVSGTAGADDRALAAWGVATGTPAVVIGEADSGVDYNHPDLAANVWSNPGGVGGCPAGTHGENIVAQTCDPMDDETQYGGHGTHVAGILGAVGNNGRGVAGMNWSTSILPVKWLDASGSGSTSQLIAALDWLIRARQAGVNVRVVNESATFVGTAYSQALADEIDLLAANDILFVTAAGNTGDDNDDPARRRYPCGYDRPNEICVTASDSSDQLPSWANYGATTVDLAAPGDNIYSTLRNGAYGYVSGASMASPQVAGAAALILSQGYRSASALRSALLDNVDPLPSLAGRVRTGGRLDVCLALTGCATPPPTATFGTTSVGAAADVMNADRKRVNPYSLTTSGTVSRLTAYLEPTQTAGQQLVKGVLYADAGGAPGRLLAVSSELAFHSTDRAGWYDLPLTTPLALGPGRYWIGLISGNTARVAAFRWSSVAGSRAYDVNSYASGPSDPFGSATTDAEQMSIYATYTPGTATVPVSGAPPTVSGTAQTGQTLTVSNGSWSETPTAYAYAWRRCDVTGAACAAIGGATGQRYVVGVGDVGSTLRATVTASNSAGASAPASSAPTAVVTQPAQTVGKTTVGASTDRFAPDRKRVNRYSAGPSGGTLTGMRIYLAPTGVSGQQVLRGVVYADAGGAPAARRTVTNELTFHSTDAVGWYGLTLPGPVTIPAGDVWIGVITGPSSNVAGFRWDPVAGSRDYNANSYAVGASDPFGPLGGSDSEQMSLYATYTPG